MKKTKIAKYWASHDLFCGDIDLGEPACMSCGYFREEWNTWEDAKQLQLCHLVPRSLGGTNDVSNIVLLCASCHDEMPDTIYKKITLKWIKENNRYLDAFEKALNLTDFNIDKSNITQKNIAEAIKTAKKTSSIHCAQTLSGPRLKPLSAFISVICAIQDSGKQLKIEFD